MKKILLFLLLFLMPITNLYSITNDSDPIQLEAEVNPQIANSPSSEIPVRDNTSVPGVNPEAIPAMVQITKTTTIPEIVDNAIENENNENAIVSSPEGNAIPTTAQEVKELNEIND